MTRHQVSREILHQSVRLCDGGQSLSANTHLRVCVCVGVQMNSCGEKLLNPECVLGIIETKLLNVEGKTTQQINADFSRLRGCFFFWFFFAGRLFISGPFAFEQNRKPANAENRGRQLKLALIAQQLNAPATEITAYTKGKARISRFLSAR